MRNPFKRQTPRTMASTDVMLNFANAGTDVSTERADASRVPYETAWTGQEIIDARNLYQNNNYARHIVNVMVANVVGHKGAEPIYEGKNRTVARLLNEFVNSQVDGMQLNEWQAWLAQRIYTDGEAFLKLQPNMRLTFVDPLSVKFPNQPLTDYHNYSGGISSNYLIGPDKMTYNSREFVHCLKRDFPHQLRGRPRLGLVSRYVDLLSKMDAAIGFNLVVTARESGYWELPPSLEREITTVLQGAVDEDGNPLTPEALTTRRQGILASWARKVTTALGITPVVPEGMKHNPIDRGTNYHANIYPVLRGGLLAASARGFGLSPTSVSGDVSEANYSSLRQASLSDQSQFRLEQSWLGGCLTRAFMLYLWEKVDLLNPADLHWEWPGFSSIDPVKDAAADKMNIELGIDSHQNVMRRKGLNPTQIQEEQAEWRRMNGSQQSEGSGAR